jgi:hypothetical protein
MKALLITSLVVGVVIAISYFGGKLEQLGKTEYSAPETQVIEKEIIVDNTNERIQKAQQDALPEITAKAQKMMEEQIAIELKEIESSVLKEVAKELEARSVQLDKETGAF